MPHSDAQYRNYQQNDGFDDFDDFDSFDGEQAAFSDGFDDFDDFNDTAPAASGYGDGFDDFDDFDDEPAPRRSALSYNAPQPPRREPVHEHDPDFDQDQFDPGPAKPPKEPKVRRFFMSLLAIVFVIAGIGLSAHFRNGFMPKDILSWRIGSVTVGDILKIGSTEELMEETHKVDNDEETPVVSIADEDLPDSVRYADFEIYEGNSYCAITGYNGTELEIVLPASYNGKPCTRIEANAFASKPITSIEIPNTYTYIGQTALSGCSITDLYLPDSVNEIGWGMCSGNKALRSVRISPSIETISEWAFANCVSITDLEIPGSVTTIGQWAFTDCTGIKKLTLCEGTVTLDNCAFYGCTSLSVVLIPSSVATIGEMCFRSCTSLMIVGLPETLQSIGKNAFMNCSQVLTIFGEEGSKWANYAKNNDLGFDLIANLDLSEGGDETVSSSDAPEGGTSAEVSSSDTSLPDAQ